MRLLLCLLLRVSLAAQNTGIYRLVQLPNRLDNQSSIIFPHA
jgi:hypothetical protein